MDALSLKDFFLIVAIVGLIFGIVVAVCTLAGQINPSEVIFFGIGGVYLSLMLAGCRYLVQLVKEMRHLHLPDDDLLTSETIRMETPLSIVHFRTGRPSRFWEGVGGKLVLTSHRLVFLAHRGQPWYYRLALSLEEIARAEESALFGGIPGGLRVTLISGKQELFTFGAIRAMDADHWAAAIYRARYHLNPQLGDGGQGF